MPYLLTDSGATTNGNERYESITGCDQYVIAGGYSKNLGYKYNGGDAGGFSVLTRIDLETLSVRWSKTFKIGSNSGGSTARSIVALALHQSATLGDRIAVFASNHF